MNEFQCFFVQNLVFFVCFFYLAIKQDPKDSVNMGKVVCITVIMYCYVYNLMLPQSIVVLSGPGTGLTCVIIIILYRV
jgi:hypothetical protein